MAVKEIVGKRMIKHEKVVRKKQSEPIQEVSNPLIYTGDEKSNWLVNVKDKFWPDSIVWLTVSTIWFDELT